MSSASMVRDAPQAALLTMRVKVFGGSKFSPRKKPHPEEPAKGGRAGDRARGEDLALLRGHLDNVTRRHGVGAPRVDLDQKMAPAGILPGPSRGRRGTTGLS